MTMGVAKTKRNTVTDINGYIRKGGMVFIVMAYYEPDGSPLKQVRTQILRARHKQGHLQALRLDGHWMMVVDQALVEFV